MKHAAGGRELDSIIAHNIFGLDYFNAIGKNPPYSTEISYAWKVVEVIQKMGGPVWLKFIKIMDSSEFFGGTEAQACILICCAALEAMQNENP